MQTKPPDPNTFMDKLRIKALNCQGLKNKCENPDLLNKITSSEIFGVSETWMSDSDAKIQIPGYNFYPFCRKKEKGSTRGGIGLFIKTEFKKGIKILYNISNEICIWCKLDKNFFRYDNDVYIGNVYIPPEGSSREKRLKEDHFKSLTETFMKIKSENVILMCGSIIWFTGPPPGCPGVSFKIEVIIPDPGEVFRVIKGGPGQFFLVIKGGPGQKNGEVPGSVPGGGR